MGDKVAAALHGSTREDILKRADAQAARYEARIAEQARLLDLQKNRILMAIGVLDEVACEGLQDEAQINFAIKVLKGEVDG